MSEMTPEQKEILENEKNTRMALQIAFKKIYDEMIFFLHKLNLNPQLKSFCFMNFDQGAMWAQNAIASIQFDRSQIFPTQKSDSVEEKIAE